MTSLRHLRTEVDSSSGTFHFDYASASPDLARLDCNECYVQPSGEELAQFAEAFGRINFTRYPEVDARTLRVAYAKYLGVEPEELLVTHGSVEAIGILIEAFCLGASRPGPVMVAEPTFPLFRVLAQHHGVPSFGVPLAHDFSLDLAAMLEAYARERPQLTFVVSPNNPTGNRLDSAVLSDLIPRIDGALVIDEAYAEFDSVTFVQKARSTPGLFVMRSLSKVGFAGLRIGALVGERAAIAALDRIRVPWNVDAAAVALGSMILTHPDMLTRRIDAVLRAKRALEGALRELPGVVVFPSAANFLLVRVPGDATRVARALLERNILVRDLSSPGLLANCLRISVGSPAENERCGMALREVLTRLEQE